MRLSCMKDDVGYDPIKIRHARVFLNGKEIELVITADEEGGYIEKYLRDSNGRLKLDIMDDLIIVKEYGKVEIKFGDKLDYIKETKQKEIKIDFENYECGVISCKRDNL